MKSNLEYSRSAAEITLGKISSWEELNAMTEAEGNEKFSQKTKELWKEFAVSGVLQFDPKEGKQVLRPFTDLDGRSALSLLDSCGVDVSNLKYVKPGEFLAGAINLDTGDKFGAVYDEATDTAFFDHHDPNTKDVTSITEVVYSAMSDLGIIEKTEAMDRLVKFVTDIDNRRLPAVEFLKSGKTILGLQRDLTFETILKYFKDHESATDELSLEEFAQYDLVDAAKKQQGIVDESMAVLDKMEKEGKVVETKYGSVLINQNNELKTGSSAAYVRHDGIINFTPQKSFAVTLKDKDLAEQEIKATLGSKFQGKIIRGKMWLYNDAEALNLNIEEICTALGGSFSKIDEVKTLDSYLEQGSPEVSKENLDLLREVILVFLKNEKISLDDFETMRKTIRSFAHKFFETVYHFGGSQIDKINPQSTQAELSNNNSEVNSAHLNNDKELGKLNRVFAFSSHNKKSDSFLAGRDFVYEFDMKNPEIQSQTRVALYDNAVSTISNRSFYARHVLEFNDYVEYFIDYSSALLLANKYEGDYEAAIEECVNNGIYNFEHLVDLEPFPQWIKKLLDNNIVMPFKPEFQIKGSVDKDYILGSRKM
ncbi:MAG: hypothetical protein NTY12_03760 [Candidatus Falkowbacteria bacterium]|nr:hypothetical protein [Candidatus Falkowbacteria bacterium]